MLRKERKRERKTMVGSDGSVSDRSKEAVGMMALHEALRSVCINSDWTYSVFWTIRPRPYIYMLLYIFVHFSLKFCCFCYLNCFLYLGFFIFTCRRLRGGNNNGCKVGDDNGSL